MTQQHRSMLIALELAFFLSMPGAAALGAEPDRFTPAGKGVTMWDLFPGPAGSEPRDLAAWRGAVVFSAEDETRGREAWLGQGDEPPFVVADIFTDQSSDTVDSSAPGKFLPQQDALYFLAPRGSGGPGVPGLWKLLPDSTASIVKPFIGGERPRDLVHFGGYMFFLTEDGVQEGLWKSDGTEAGTQPLRQVSNARALIATELQIFFVVESDLWKSDGSAAGTVSLGQLTPVDLRRADGFFAHGNFFFFREYSRDLWVIDAAQNEARQLITESAGTNRGPQHLTPCQGNFFFAHTVVEQGSELWVTDGTVTGTLRDLAEGPASSDPDFLVAVGDTLFFVADDGVRGREVCRTDGTPGGTTCIDLVPGSGGSNPHSLIRAPLDDGIVFVASTPDRGAELVWLGQDGVQRQNLPELLAGPADAGPREPTRAGLWVYLVADDGQHGAELWSIDLVSPRLLTAVSGCLTGPQEPFGGDPQPSLALCTDAFDAESDGDVDLLDAAVLYNRAFAY